MRRLFGNAALRLAFVRRSPGFTLALAFAVAAVATSSPSPSGATTINLPTPGSNAFIATYEIDSGRSVCDIQCTIVSSPTAPLTLPLNTLESTNHLTFITSSGEAAPDALRSFTSSNVGSEIDVALRDTYTVQGTGSGAFDITVTLHATGTAKGIAAGSNIVLLGGQVTLTIGTFNIDPPTVIPTVDPFVPGTTRAQQALPVTVSASDFTIPIDVMVSYTRSVHVGDVFDIAYEMASDTGKGTVDLSHTATIAFDTPTGVYLTSALGGTFGDAPTSVPAPAAGLLFATGLGGLALMRRKARGR